MDQLTHALKSVFSRQSPSESSLANRDLKASPPPSQAVGDVSSSAPSPQGVEEEEAPESPFVVVNYNPFRDKLSTTLPVLEPDLVALGGPPIGEAPPPFSHLTPEGQKEVLKTRNRLINRLFEKYDQYRSCLMHPSVSKKQKRELQSFIQQLRCMLRGEGMHILIPDHERDDQPLFGYLTQDECREILEKTQQREATKIATLYLASLGLNVYEGTGRRYSEAVPWCEDFAYLTQQLKHTKKILRYLMSAGDEMSIKVARQIHLGLSRLRSSPEIDFPFSKQDWMQFSNGVLDMYLIVWTNNQ